MSVDSFFSTAHCQTPSEFITALSPRGAAYPSAFPRAWIFRGHPDDNFSLVPTALRKESEALTELTLFPIATNAEQVFSEREVLKQFLRFSDSTGLHLPEDTQTLRRWLDLSAKNIEVWPPHELLSIMALAQHHGVPTRLLDWSRHPLKAAWFAASEASESEEKAGLLSVWALSIELLEMLGEGEPKPFIVITAPSATNPNLRAQEGIFTLAKHIVPGKSTVDRTSFDELLRASFQKYKVKAPGPWFHRVTLPRVRADDLVFDLALEGINRATLFPDFYGVVMAMKDAARWQKDGGPGERRTKKRLESLTISYETKVFVRGDATGKQTPPGTQ
jgi:FRG domain